MVIDKEYEKYIRFYLDSTLNQKKLNKVFSIYPTGVNKKYTAYIQKLSGCDDYMLSYPVSATWNLTSACNFRCVHCLYNDTKYSSENDLSTVQAMKLADELIHDFGVVYVLLTGGELFLRNDTMDLIRKFKANNVGVKILTNASLMTEAQIDEIAELFNPYTDSVHISLDGAKNETFKKIRHTDTFEKIIQNTKKLCYRKVKVTAVCTVSAINYSEVIDIYKLAGELGCYGFVASPVEYHNPSHTELMVSNKNLFKLAYELFQCETPTTPCLAVTFFSPIDLLNIPEVLTVIKEEHYQNIIKAHSTEIQQRSCQYHDKISIQSDGRIYLCLEALANDLAPIGSYKNNSLLEIWENRHENMLFKLRKIENMICNDCRYNTYCNSGCKSKHM